MSNLRDTWGQAVLRIRKALDLPETIRTSLFRAETLAGYLPIENEQTQTDLGGARVFFEALRKRGRDEWEIFFYPDYSSPLITPLVNYPRRYKPLGTVKTRAQALAELRKWERLGMSLRRQIEKPAPTHDPYAQVNVNHISRIDPSFAASATLRTPALRREGNLIHGNFLPRSAAPPARPAAAGLSKISRMKPGRAG